MNGVALLAVGILVGVAQLTADGDAEASIARWGVFVIAITYPFAFYLSAYRYFFPSLRSPVPGSEQAPA